MDPAQPVTPGSTAAAALEALANARSKEEAEAVLSGKDLSSLNKFLQWSTAHSDPNVQPTKSAEQVEQDREWLDAAFPDVYADVKKLVSLLTASEPLPEDDAVCALESLEELFADMNHAVNIDKVGALQPLLDATRSPYARVRAAALWALGSALQDLEEVKKVFMERKGDEVLVRCLQDEEASVRSKAVRAASALLRHSGEDIRGRFEDVGGGVALRRLVADRDVQVRRKARFFLQHANATGNEEFVRRLLNERNVVADLSQEMQALDVDDIADVEAAVGAVNVLVKMDRQGVLQVAPELPGVVDGLVQRCGDEEMREKLVELSALLA